MKNIILYGLILITFMVHATEKDKTEATTDKAIKKTGSLMQSVKKEHSEQAEKKDAVQETATIKSKIKMKSTETKPEDKKAEQDVVQKEQKVPEIYKEPKKEMEELAETPEEVSKPVKPKIIPEKKEPEETPAPKLSIQVTDRTKPESASVVHISPAEEKAAQEALKGPKKPVTAVEKAEAGIVALPKKKEVELEEGHEMPIVPEAIDVKEEAAQKEKVDLDLTPPECLPSELDTTGVDAGGNWVIKRAFWEQAEKTYEKIMKANNSLYDQQVKFVKAHNAIDKIGDTAFRELGFEQGKLSELLENLIDEVKEQREQQGDLDEKEREFLQTLKEKQRDLEQLRLDLKAVSELDESLNKVMSNLNQQVGACRKYEKQAWERFKAIGKELNDKKARLLFYEMEGFLKTVEKNRDYVTNDLWNYFDDSAQQIKDHLDKMRTVIDNLKNKGTDLTKEFERFAQADRVKDEKELEEEKEQIKKELAEIEQKKKALEQGIWGQFKAWTFKLFKAIKTTTSMAYKASSSWVSNVFTSLKKMIGMKK